MQHGYGLLPVLAVLALLGMGVATTQMIFTDSIIERNRSTKYELDLDRVASEIESAYERANIEPHGTATIPEALQRHLPLLPSRASLKMSLALAKDGVVFRRFVIYELTGTDTTQWNELTGEFSAAPDTRWRLIDGYAVQSRRILQTQQHLGNLALAFQRRFSLRVAADPLHDSGINHFRPTSTSCVPSRDELPCVDVYVPLSQLVAQSYGSAKPLSQSVGLAEADYVSAWGTPIEFSNLLDSQVSSPPFTAALRVVTPWGYPIIINAVQQIN
jgi:hypothetical protein